LVNSLGYTRWDPKARAGAVAVRKSGVDGVGQLSQHVSGWARYQNLAGEHDSVETSPITGTYDWRSYIQEETQLARRREEKEKPREKKVQADAPSAPSVFYA
jgi:hypothetical protein